VRLRKRHPASGSRPGTLAISERSPRPRIFVIRYGPDFVEEEREIAVGEIPTEFETGTVTWVDVRGLGDEAIVRAVGDRFELSPLALEDAVNVPQRAKSELYAQHHLIISRVPIPMETGDLEVPQVCFVVGERFLLTFQERPFRIFDPVRERIRAGIGPIRESGADYLAYALIDTMVDRYYPVAEGLADRLDEVEQQLHEESDEKVRSVLRRVRGQLVLLRRIGWPQREMVNALLREQSPFIGPGVRTYLRDTNDHIAQIAELVDSSRDHAAALSDELQSAIAERTNEVMKVLTLMASVFIPLTFIAGVYGMNFENMPELRTRIGYYVVLGVMTAVAVAMVVYFWRRGWIRRRRRPPRSR
jgi:magnesium transporter